MRFNNPIPRTGMPRLHESSRLRSHRDSDATPKIWQKAVPIAKNGERLASAVEMLQRQFDRLRRRSGSESQTGMIYKGEWANDQIYSAQNVVTRTSLGEFICMQTPPAGTQPETGSPYWHAFGYPPPGNWF